MHHLYQSSVHQGLRPEVPRNLPPQKQSSSCGVDVNMTQMSIPSAGTVQPLGDIHCANHVLGRHECLNRNCRVRQDDSNETAHPWGFQWFGHMEHQDEIAQMNGPQGRVTLILSCHPHILQNMANSIDPRTLERELEQFMFGPYMTSGAEHYSYPSTAKKASIAKTQGLHMWVRQHAYMSGSQSKGLTQAARGRFHHVECTCYGTCLTWIWVKSEDST